MQLGKGTVLIGIMIGAVAVYLYVQHDEQVSHLQGVAMAQQRCTVCQVRRAILFFIGAGQRPGQYRTSGGPGQSRSIVRPGGEVEKEHANQSAPVLERGTGRWQRSGPIIRASTERKYTQQKQRR